MTKPDTSIILGENNTIEQHVTIGNNVIIGNNNIIKKGTIIYENTTIGDNNIFLEDNVIGSLPVEANIPYHDISRYGLIIGNNNFFHIKNIISSGYYSKTIICNDNKFLSDVYISHDNIIHDNVTFYPRVFSAGLVEFFNHSSIGACACIHQRLKIGAYSMIGMNSSIVKNVYPYMICVNNNKYTNINHKKINEFGYSCVISQLKNVLFSIQNNNVNIDCLPDSLKSDFEKVINFTIKIKLVYCISFYDNVKPEMKSKKRECTRKFLRYLQYIKHKFNDNIDMKFIICGSEGDDSKKFVLSENFNEDEYFEFDQGPYGDNILTLIEEKFEYSIKKGIEKYPDYNVIILTGSSDFIPEHFFERLSCIDLNEALVFGVKSYKDGGALVLNNYKDDKVYIRDYDCILQSRNKNSRIQSALKYIDNLSNLKLIGGIIGLTRSSVMKMDNYIPFPQGNEFETYNTAYRKGCRSLGLSDFWINIKVPSSDYHSFEDLSKPICLRDVNSSDKEIINLMNIINSL